MREISMTQGYVTQVDDEDYEWLLDFTWVPKPKPGATIIYATAWNKIKSRGNLMMHRLIWERHYGLKPGDEIDHIDGNGLNNRKENLRLVTRTQNMQNARPYRGGSSKYKGVSRRRGTNRWVAYIRIDGKLYSLGSYGDEVEAALTYDDAAREHFGEFARTNF